MKKIILLQRAMVVNRTFACAVIQRHTSLSQSYIYSKIKAYEKDGFIKRAGLGSNQEKLWRLTLKGKRQFDPNTPKESVIHTLGGGRNRKNKDFERPELRLWAAIKELKSFKMIELQDMNLANKTTTHQYVALLLRAGFLSSKRLIEQKNKQYEGCYPKLYTVTEKAGVKAPLMGRTFYVFDPNSGDFWATPMEKFEI